MQLITRHAIFADQALTTWRPIWAEICIQESTSSFALDAADFLHRLVVFAISFALFIAAFIDRVVVLIGPDTQLNASSSPDHIE